MSTEVGQAQILNDAIAEDVRAHLKDELVLDLRLGVPREGLVVWGEPNIGLTRDLARGAHVTNELGPLASPQGTKPVQLERRVRW